ncbi:MAG TPA: hypothetical protein VE964_16515, partial [Myxococcales bacterium]|nr:hypothetical protein [Myxococcales bacterium]
MVVQVMLAVALAAASPAPDAPSAIPGPQLVRAAEGAYAELLRISELAGSNRFLDELAAPLATMERELDRLRSAGPASRTAAFDVEAEYVGREVAQREALVQRWDEQLSTHVQLLDGAATSLARMLESWRLTAASLDSDAPPALVARAGDVRDRAAEMQRLVRRRLSAVLELQDRVAGAKLALSALAARLEAANAARRQELFDIESTPLWRAAAWTRSLHFPDPLRVLRVNAREGTAYAASEPMRSILHLALALALIAVMLAVTRKLRTTSSIPSSVPVEVVTRYPVDSAILLAVVAAPLFHPTRPPALVLLLYFAGLLPVVRIAGVLAAGWRRPVRWVAALVVLERLVAYAPEVGVPARLALLFVATAALTACAAGLRKGGWLRRLDTGRWK